MANGQSPVLSCALLVVFLVTLVHLTSYQVAAHDDVFQVFEPLTLLIVAF